MNHRIWIISSALILVLIGPLSAQKAKLSNVKVTANYLKAPNLGLPQDVNSYSVSVGIDEGLLHRGQLTRNKIKNRIKLSGYPKLEEGGDVIIMLDIGDVVFQKKELKTETKKNKEGKTWKEYYGSMKYAGSHTYKIVSRDGEILYEPTKSSTTNKTWKSKNYKTIAQLDKNWKNNYKSIYNSSTNKLILENLKAINTSLNKFFGLVPVNETIKFKSLKEKKHPDYQQFLSHDQNIISAFQKMNTKNIDSFALAIDPVISFWSKKEETYDANHKEEKKLKYACQYNMALACFWAENFEKSKEYALRVMNGNHKSKDGKKLINKIDDVYERMNKINWISRHFAIEINEEDVALEEQLMNKKENAKGNSIIDAFPEFNDRLLVTGESSVIEGVSFSRAGKEIIGVFVFENGGAVTPDFTKPGKIRYAYNNGGKLKIGVPNYSKLDSMYIGDVKYEIRDLKIGTGLLTQKISNNVITVDQNYSKTQLITSYATKENMATTTKLVYNKDENRYFALEGTMTLIKGFSKSLAKAIEDCSDLSEEVKNKNFKEKDYNEINEILIRYDSCNGN